MEYLGWSAKFWEGFFENYIFPTPGRYSQTSALKLSLYIRNNSALNTLPMIVFFFSTLRISLHLFQGKKVAAHLFKKRERKMMGLHTRLRENEDLLL